MNPGERLQLLLALLCQLHQNAPAVFVIDETRQQSELHHPVDQFDGGVMPNQQKTGEIPDRGRRWTREALDRKQRLMLLGGQTGLAGCRFAKGQKQPKLVSKPRKRSIIDRSRRRTPAGKARGVYRLVSRSPRRLRHLVSRRRHPVCCRNDATKRGAAGPSRAGVFNGSLKRRRSTYSYVEVSIFNRMIWKATGMRALLRRIDLSSAAVISVRVNFPLDALAASSCQAADNDLWVLGGGSM